MLFLAPSHSHFSHRAIQAKITRKGVVSERKSLYSWVSLATWTKQNSYNGENLRLCNLVLCGDNL